MAKIIILPEVMDSLEDLVKILISKGYPGFEDSAQEYVANIVAFMFTLPYQKRKFTRSNKYGDFYCKYKHNRHTTFYITFDEEDEIYLIKNIITNHTIDYPIYILGKLPPATTRTTTTFD